MRLSCGRDRKRRGDPASILGICLCLCSFLNRSDQRMDHRGADMETIADGMTIEAVCVIAAMTVPAIAVAIGASGITAAATVGVMIAAVEGIADSIAAPQWRHQRRMRICR